jgi:hypothetical protein
MIKFLLTYLFRVEPLINASTPAIKSEIKGLKEIEKHYFTRFLDCARFMDILNLHLLCRVLKVFRTCSDFISCE